MGDNHRFLLATVIKESRWILELEDNWDDNGSMSYGKATWNRASRLVEKIYIDGEIEYQLPRILPGPDGSIDLHWEAPEYKAIANIPHKKDENIGLYGHSAGEMIIIDGRFSDEECVRQIKQFFNRLNDLGSKK